jgi:hypothetical protein
VIKEITEKPIPKRTIPKKVMAIGFGLLWTILPESLLHSFGISISFLKAENNMRIKSKNVLTKFIVNAEIAPYNKAEITDVRIFRGEKTTI